jgi:hypothetical protein
MYYDHFCLKVELGTAQYLTVYKLMHFALHFKAIWMVASDVLSLLSDIGRNLVGW